jgi:molybdopterin-guanine dinucleotide biosynthesis protein A
LRQCENTTNASDRHAPVRGYVLAGGGSTRFGRDKALAEINGKTMLLQMCELIFYAVPREVRVIGDASKYGKYGVTCVADGWPGQGPLGGIITALLETANSATRSEWNLILSCDMPFLTEEMLAYCVDRARKSHAEVVVPRSKNGLEPLCACWRTSATAKLRRAFDEGIRKVTEGMKRLDMEILDESDWKRFDTAGRLFWNMNTPLDYEEAKRILEAQRA